MNIVKGAIAALALSAAAASTALAQYELNIVGSANVRDPSGGGGSTLLIDFIPPVTAVPTTNLPGILPFVTTGGINDVLVNTTGCANCTVNPFITIGGYTFTLTSTPVAPAGPFNFGPVALMQAANGTTASLSVNGNVTGGIFGTQTATYSGVFTAQFVGNTPAQVFNAINSGGTRNVSFSADLIITPPNVVPEPATVALMATGLVGLIGFARRRSQA